MPLNAEEMPDNPPLVRRRPLEPTAPAHRACSGGYRNRQRRRQAGRSRDHRGAGRGGQQSRLAASRFLTARRTGHRCRNQSSGSSTSRGPITSARSTCMPCAASPSLSSPANSSPSWAHRDRGNPTPRTLRSAVVNKDHDEIVLPPRLQPIPLSWVRSAAPRADRGWRPSAPGNSRKKTGPRVLFRTGSR